MESRIRYPDKYQLGRSQGFDKDHAPYVQKLNGGGNAANYKIGLYPGTNWTQAYALKALMFERRLELCLEGHRFYDLARWGIADQVMNNCPTISY